MTTTTTTTGTTNAQAAEPGKVVPQPHPGGLEASAWLDALLAVA